MRKMRQLITYVLALWAFSVFAQQQYGYPVPRDPNNTPIYGGLGLPFTETVTVDVTTFSTKYATVPLTGVNLYRQYRSVYLYNPSTTRTIYACFSNSTACTTSQVQVEPGFAMALDGVYYGYINDTTRIYLKLDSAGSVDARVGGW